MVRYRFAVVPADARGAAQKAVRARQIPHDEAAHGARRLAFGGCVGRNGFGEIPETNQTR